MQRTDDLRIREMKELTPPSHLIREFACTDAASATAANARVALHRILHGQDDRLMVVIGPCSIHDTGAAMEYAARLVKERRRGVKCCGVRATCRQLRCPQAAEKSGEAACQASCYLVIVKTRHGHTGLTDSHAPARFLYLLFLL